MSFDIDPEYYESILGENFQSDMMEMIADEINMNMRFLKKMIRLHSMTPWYQFKKKRRRKDKCVMYSYNITILEAKASLMLQSIF